VLWRASISTECFFKGIDLGALENQAKQIIWKRHIPSIHDFSFVLSKFDDDGAGRTISTPHKECWFNINYYRFYLYGYILDIKVDPRKTPKRWKKFIPEDENLFVISRGNMRNAKEYSLMLQTASMPQNIKEFT
jgi:hypothetical protein